MKTTKITFYLRNILFLIGFLIIFQNVFSQDEVQTLKLYSLLNKGISVNVDFDYDNNRVDLELNSREKMVIKGFRYLVQDIKILDQKFIELQIGMRGGSGVSVHRYVLICVSDNKFFRSVDLISEVKNLVDGSNECKVNFTGLTEKGKSIELVASGESTFHFDWDNKIFYNDFVTLNGPYLISTDDTLNEQIIFSNERVPSICVNINRKYVFVRDNWFGVIQDNHLQDIEFDQ